MLDKSLYFYRAAVYSESGGEVALADIHHPDRTTPLEPWFGLVIPLADGQHTLNELFRFIAQRYQGNPPANLDETLTSVVERLVEGKLVVLSEAPVQLPYYLSQAIEYLDLEKAQKLMAEDGLTLH